MANQLSLNPWVIDTTVGTLAAPVILYPGNIRHGQIEYVEYTAATDFCAVFDRYGHLVAYLHGESTLRTVRTGMIGWVYGMQVPTQNELGVTNLPSGKIIFYYE